MHSVAGPLGGAERRTQPLPLLLPFVSNSTRNHIKCFVNTQKIKLYYYCGCSYYATVFGSLYGNTHVFVLSGIKKHIKYSLPKVNFAGLHYIFLWSHLKSETIFWLYTQKLIPKKTDKCVQVQYNTTMLTIKKCSKPHVTMSHVNPPLC